MNPFLDTYSANDISDISISLSTLDDVNISNPKDGEIVTYDQTTSKWINKTGGGGSTGSSTLQGLTDCSISSATVGQLLRYNGTQWANSDGSIALSSLTDCNIGSVSDKQTLKYNSSTSKWINVNDTLSTLVDCSISSPAITQSLVYNGTQWVNFQVDHLNLLNIGNNSHDQIDTTLQKIQTSTGTTKTSVNTTQNTTIKPSYTDGLDNNIIFSDVSILTPSSLKGTLYSASSTNLTINGAYVNNNGTTDCLNYTNNSSLCFNRYNIDFGSVFQFTEICWDFTSLINGNNISIFVYGSNTTSLFNDNNPVTIDLLPTYITTLCIFSPTQLSGSISISDNGRYRYILIGVKCISTTSSITYSTGTKGFYLKQYLENSFTRSLKSGVDFNISTDSSTGYPMITYLDALQQNLVCNQLTLLLNESYRRLFPVIRDANTIILSDGTNTITLTSTLGYPISKCADVVISLPSNNQVLSYNSTTGKWQNITLSLGSSYLSSLGDCSITSPTNNQSLIYVSNKWQNLALSSGLLNDFSVSGVANDQVLVYTTSLNKWIPYTLAGVVFNDTTKTITVSGITALSGLTTDVTISSPSNNQVLSYNSTTGKWQNITLSLGSSYLSSLGDCSIASPANNQALIYVSNKWQNLSLSSGLLSDFSVSGVANDQVLVYTTTSNKWIPYTLTGVVFNDTTNTITVSGTTALSGLTTDVTISSPSNNQVLTYSNSKWINQSIPNMSLVSLSDVSILGQTNNQVILWNNSTSKWYNSTLSSALLSDFSISSPANNNVIQYNSTTGKWVNSTLQTGISKIQTSLSQGGVCSVTYVDGTDSNIANCSMIAYNILSITTHVYSSSLSISGYKIVNNGTGFELNTSNLTDYARINIAYPTAFTASSFVVYNSTGYNVNLQNIMCTVYGSNTLSYYNDTTNTTTGLTLLGSLSSLVIGINTILITNVNTFKYFHMFAQNMINGVNAELTIYGGITMGYYAVYPTSTSIAQVLGTDYSITSNSTTGYPQITYTDINTVNLTYDVMKVLLSEAYRRLYVVVRDTNTIKLTDRTHNITLNSTNCGYSISQMSDVTITTPLNSQIIQYNSGLSKWINSSLPSSVILKSQTINTSGTTIITSYVDGTDSNICYGNPISCNIVSLTYHSGSALSINGYKVVNINSSGYELYTTNTTDYARINMMYAIPYQIGSIVVYLTPGYTVNLQNIMCTVYGSNTLSYYNDTTNTTTNLTLLGSSTLLLGTTTITVSNSSAFQYVHLFLQNTVNGTQCGCDIVSSAGYYAILPLQTSQNNFVNGSQYTVSSDNTTGYPAITFNLGNASFNFIYDILKLLISEAYRRLYPVVRDTNTIYLTDGTNTQTLSSTVGYPISKSSDCTISNPSSGHSLIYNSSTGKWQNRPQTAKISIIQCYDYTFYDASYNITVPTYTDNICLDMSNTQVGSKLILPTLTNLQTIYLQTSSNGSTLTVNVYFGLQPIYKSLSTYTVGGVFLVPNTRYLLTYYTSNCPYGSYSGSYPCYTLDVVSDTSSLLKPANLYIFNTLNTVTCSYSLKLPSANIDGTTVDILDYKGFGNITSFTLYPNTGDTINKLSSSVSLNTANFKMKYVYSSTFLDYISV